MYRFISFRHRTTNADTKLGTHVQASIELSRDKSNAASATYVNDVNENQNDKNQVNEVMDEYSYAYAEVKGDSDLDKTNLTVSAEFDAEKAEYSYTYADVKGESDLAGKTNLAVSGESDVDKPIVYEVPDNKYPQNAKNQIQSDQQAYTDLKFEVSKELEAGDLSHLYTPLKQGSANNKRDGKPEEADIVYTNDTVIKSRQRMKRL